MTGIETEKQPAAGAAQRVEAAARALANEVAPESHLEHWGTQPEWLKDKFRRRAALALAAADAVDALHTTEAARIWQEGRESLAAGFLLPLDEFGRRPATPNPYLSPAASTPEQGMLFGVPAPVPAPVPAAATDPDCDGYCHGTVCSYCGCCVHTADPSSCRTSSAPAGMRCPENGCGCEGTAG